MACIGLINGYRRCATAPKYAPKTVKKRHEITSYTARYGENRFYDARYILLLLCKPDTIYSGFDTKYALDMYRKSAYNRKYQRAVCPKTRKELSRFFPFSSLIKNRITAVSSRSILARLSVWRFFVAERGEGDKKQRGLSLYSRLPIRTTRPERLTNRALSGSFQLALKMFAGHSSPKIPPDSRPDFTKTWGTI